MLIDKDDRGEDFRRGESRELLGVGVLVELLDSARLGKENCCGGVEGLFVTVDRIVGDEVGVSCFGD